MSVAVELSPQEQETIEKVTGRVASVFWGGLITLAGLELPVIVRALQTRDAPIEEMTNTWMIALAVSICVLVPLGFLSFEWFTRQRDARGLVPPGVFMRAAIFRILCLLATILFAQLCVLITGQLFPYSIFQMLMFLLLFTLWPTDGPMRKPENH